MKKISFIGLLLLQIIAGRVSAQMVANDDVFDGLQGIEGGYSTSYTQGENPLKVINNDLLNGNAFNYSQVTLTQISTTNPSVTLATNFGGYIYVAPGTPTGSYQIVYQICSNANPALCDTAVITVNVCSIARPNLNKPDSCDDPFDTFEITGLPSSGTWSLYRGYLGSPIAEYSLVATGTGTTYTDSGLPPVSPPETHGFGYRVEDAQGCSAVFGVWKELWDLDVNAVLTGEYIDSNSNGIVDLNDMMKLTMMVTNNLNCTMQTVRTLDQYFYNLEPGATVSLVVYLPIDQNDINNGYYSLYYLDVWAYSNGYELNSKVTLQSNVPLQIADGIRLNAFIDANTNGTRDVGEVDYNDTYNVTINGVNHGFYTPTGNVVVYETNPANVYSISVGNSSNCTYIFPPALSNITVPSGSGITTYNFPVVFNGNCEDLKVDVFQNGAPPIPGFNFVNRIVYRNNGMSTIASGSINFASDNAVTIVGVSPTGPVITPGSMTYNFVNLAPDESRYIDITMHTPTIPTVSLGQHFTNTVSASIPPDDINTANNSSAITQTVVGSYDPNDKAENHGATIVHSTFTSDDVLTYTIRFENTGTAPATDVRVTDVLDPKLDETSIRMVYATHNYLLERTGNNLEWMFNNISLPVSANGSTGKGYLVFTIKPKPGYAIGDIIPNSANIYFDTNPAIVTNTVNTEFVSTLNVDHIQDYSLSFFPNPVKDHLTVTSKEKIGEITISDITGQTIMSIKPNAVDINLDLNPMQAGIYLVRVKSAEAEKIFKIIKE
ncbi:MAG: hypothetical protein CFE23_06470 [Flavobacterium sp. BFFFF1]|uniref:DUF7619 domain-containing protein n=1 Tax=Flavobacterium sp. BFFFF1 TaxID=2015557 RepID=UPI000BD477D3|nr:T9SS type A sorting domain-containing protein [Flavobacterium sp. BFFFF1]OYU81129.1 MAG: hypothetical protein CFE23_06470 [Flavobacterium sp. BFFFF1]